MCHIPLSGPVKTWKKLIETCAKQLCQNFLSFLSLFTLKLRAWGTLFLGEQVVGGIDPSTIYTIIYIDYPPSKTIWEHQSSVSKFASLLPKFPMFMRQVLHGRINTLGRNCLFLYTKRIKLQLPRFPMFNRKLICKGNTNLSASIHSLLSLSTFPLVFWVSERNTWSLILPILQK